MLHTKVGDGKFCKTSFSVPNVRLAGKMGTVCQGHTSYQGLFVFMSRTIQIKDKIHSKDYSYQGKYSCIHIKDKIHIKNNSYKAQLMVRTIHVKDYSYQGKIISRSVLSKDTSSKTIHAKDNSFQGQWFISRTIRIKDKNRKDNSYNGQFISRTAHFKDNSYQGQN